MDQQSLNSASTARTWNQPTYSYFSLFSTPPCPSSSPQVFYPFSQFITFSRTNILIQNKESRKEGRWVMLVTVVATTYFAHLRCQTCFELLFQFFSGIKCETIFKSFLKQGGENYCCDNGNTCCGHLGLDCCPIENVRIDEYQCHGKKVHASFFMQKSKGVCCEDRSCCSEGFLCLPPPGGCGLARQNNTDNEVTPSQFSITSQF